MKLFKLLALVGAAYVGYKTISTNKGSNKFKKSYESFNNKGYKDVQINAINPVVYSNALQVLEMIEDKKSFYIYFGSPLCPWCRACIESMLEVAKLKGINNIYYVELWDKEKNEILRDRVTYDTSGNKIYQKANDGYFELLEKLDKFLPDYKVEFNGEQIYQNEKRLYMPTFVCIENGEVIRVTDGRSEIQTNPNKELSKDEKNEQIEKFKKFFDLKTTCDIHGNC